MNSRKKLFAIVMSMLMMLTFMPQMAFAGGVTNDVHSHSFDANGGCLCGAHGSGSTPTDHTSWTELTQTDFTEDSGHYGTLDRYWLTGGNYYLNSDIQLDHPMSFDGNVNICLNGHFLVGDGETAAIQFEYTNDSKANFYDCQKTVHYFAFDEEKEIFSDYKGTSKPNGTEGTDYIKVQGGGFTGFNGIVNSGSNSNRFGFNMYGLNVIGNASGNNYSFYVGKDTSLCSLNGLTITNNEEASFTICGNTTLDTCLIKNNLDTRMDAFNGTFLLKNTQISNNIVTEKHYALSFCESYDPAVPQLKLSGNTIIKDNKCDGTQCNFVLDSSVGSVVLDNLTSQENTIGLSVNDTESDPVDQLDYTISDSSSSTAFFCDNPVFIMTRTGDAFKFVKRNIIQPTQDNGYKYDIDQTDLTATSYQWYKVKTKKTNLTDKNTTAYGTYSENEWKAADGGNLFQTEFPKGETLVFDVDFNGAVPSGEIFVVLAVQKGTKTLTLTIPVTDQDTFTFLVNNSASYSLKIMSTAQSDPALKRISIKNVRLEAYEYVKVDDEIENALKTDINGTYYCQATLSNAFSTKTIASKTVEKTDGRDVEDDPTPDKREAVIKAIKKVLKVAGVALAVKVGVDALWANPYFMPKTKMELAKIQMANIQMAKAQMTKMQKAKRQMDIKLWFKSLIRGLFF